MYKFNDVRKNENKGFSLIELIVVVAIMAVLVAVLAPSLLAYVERSRAQKDDSAMAEVTNAVKLALADQDIYDEMLLVNEGAAAERYMTDYDDEQANDFGTVSGLTMRGATITFKPVDAIITIENGVLNAWKGGNGDGTLAALGTKAMSTRLKSIVGDTIKLTSQTYRNSDYTVFIKMGTLKQDAAITVKGEWNGTNLPKQTATQDPTESTT